ncbi:aldehyde ferredoxin oxidoreductase C-terminal domain-containing protein [Chloroflexota bacterium]
MLNKKIAWIDLTNRTVKTEIIPMEWRRKYLGSRGIMALLEWSLTDAKSDPLSPEAPLLIGVGWMTGIPSFGGRCFVGGMNPNRPGLSIGSIGGYWGPEVKYAGFEQLVITGKSKTPVYLWITNDNIEFLDADYLRGLEVMETQEAIRRHHDDHEIRSVVIGPAGENLVRSANIMTGWKDSFGGSRWGWLMGAKKLKAIAARGTGDIELAHPEEYLLWMKEQQDKLHSSKWIRAMGRYGSLLLLSMARMGGWATYQGGKVPLGKKLEAVTADKFDPYTVSMAACHGCSVHCRHRHYIAEGKYAGTKGEGPEWSHTSMYSGSHEIVDPEAIMALCDQSNRLGMSGPMSNIEQLMEEGIITEEDVGYYIGRNDPDALSRLMDDTAYRRTPFGNIVADGPEGLKRLPREIPPRTEGRAGVKAFGMAERVNILPGYTKTNRPGIDVLGLPEDFLEKFYGGKVSGDIRSYEGKDRMVWFHEQNASVADSLGLCRFQDRFNSPHMPDFNDYVELIRLTTGMDFSVDEITEIASRITTMERLAQNQLGGGTRESERLKEPGTTIKEGALAGDFLDPAKVDEFLDGFYKLHGWDNNGIPTKELIEKLGIAKVKGL